MTQSDRFNLSKAGTIGSLVVVLVAVLLFFGTIALYENWESSRAEPVANDLRHFLEATIIRIDVVPDFKGYKDFEYVITDNGTMEAFRSKTLVVDTVQISGHSGPTYESVIVITTSDGARRFQASIHKREPHDLFLKPDITFQQYAGQNYGGRLPVVRIAELADWMLVHAPDGAL